MSTLPEIFLFPLSSCSFVRNGRGERGKRKIPELASLPVAPNHTPGNESLLTCFLEMVFKYKTTAKNLPLLRITTFHGKDAHPINFSMDSLSVFHASCDKKMSDGHRKQTGTTYIQPLKINEFL
jgi:hypothetical protein